MKEKKNKLLLVIGEINANTLSMYLDYGYGDKDCDVLVSGPGGDIGYTLAMLDDIDFYKRTTIATGICQSAAAVLATAGEGKRICTMDTLFRFLSPSLENGDKDVTDHQWFLHSVLVARLAQRTGLQRIEVTDLFDGEFINSIRAKELGLIDEVISTEVSNGNSDRFPGSEGEVIDSANDCDIPF